MQPFLFSCKKCPETFRSSKSLRCHTCCVSPGIEISDNETEKDSKDFIFPTHETKVEGEERDFDSETKKGEAISLKTIQDIYEKTTQDISFKTIQDISVKNPQDISAKTTQDIAKVGNSITEAATAVESQTKLVKCESGALEAKKEEVETNAFTCPLCKRFLPSLASLEVHTRIHELDKSIPCQFKDCGASFTLKKRLVEHMQRVHGEEKDNMAAARFKCEHCDKIFDRKSGLKIHGIKHSQDKNFLCVLCPKRFKNRDSLRLHKKRHNGVEDFKCEYCDRRYVASSLLKTHIRDKHKISTEVFTCDHCKNEFNKKEKLKSHLTLHTGEKPFKCRVGCEKGFRNRVPREDHERMHRGVKEFQCTRCPKMFMKSSSLRVHMKRHEGKKDHQCAVCGKAFVEPAGARNCRHSSRKDLQMQYA